MVRPIKSIISENSLQSYIVQVYNYTCLALLITAVTAVVTISFELLVDLLFILDKNGKYYGLTGAGILVAFSPLIVSTFFVLNFKYVSPTGAKLLLYIYSALIGASLAQIGLIYFFMY